MPSVFAHRGLHLIERENTPEAFSAAVALGVDGVELDVRRSLDGALVVHHDPSVGGLVIAQTLARDLPSHVAALDEVMEHLRGVRVNVEIKNIRDPSEPTYDETGDFARQVLAFLDEGDWSESVIVSCFDLATCIQVRAIDEAVSVGWLWWDVEPSHALAAAGAARLNAVHPHYSLVDGALVRRARDLGLDTNVWTVNRDDDIKAMVSHGVSSIITDDPALALAILGERP